MPLPVNQALYETWENVLDDLRKLLRGEEGISVVEAAQLGDHRWDDPPGGYVHVARLLEEPGDIMLNIRNLEALEGERTRVDVERVLRDIFGDKYVPQMKPTQLLSRFARMKSELERVEDTLERKSVVRKFPNRDTHGERAEVRWRGSALVRGSRKREIDAEMSDWLR